MIWKDAILLGRVKTGTDRLNNPVYEEKPVGKVPARFTEWTAEDVELEGREVTADQRRLLLRTTWDKLPLFQKVQFEGKVYLLQKTLDLSPRLAALYVARWKE